MDEVFGIFYKKGESWQFTTYCIPMHLVRHKRRTEFLGIHGNGREILDKNVTNDD